jgi:hypothetical protein
MRCTEDPKLDKREHDREVIGMKGVNIKYVWGDEQFD